MKKLIVKISWPELDYMPDSKTSFRQSANGYQSVAELQTELKKRRKDAVIIPGGVRYSEQFNAFGESGLRVFEVTLR